jgi:phosphomannomutase
VKNKITCPREKVAEACAALESHFDSATASSGDGLRLDWDDRWVQVRASNTEPIIRVIAEAPQNDEAQQLCEAAMEIVGSAVS